MKVEFPEGLRVCRVSMFRAVADGMVNGRRVTVTRGNLLLVKEGDYEAAAQAGIVARIEEPLLDCTVRELKAITNLSAPVWIAPPAPA